MRTLITPYQYGVRSSVPCERPRKGASKGTREGRWETIEGHFLEEVGISHKSVSLARNKGAPIAVQERRMNLRSLQHLGRAGGRGVE